ncbi:MAG: hypothetical protein KUG71_03005 [Porticoccaceae bacterium]|nr:hypothetical protein [Porticoccaceae bacterium]
MTLLPESQHSIAQSLATKHLTNATDRRMVFLLEDSDKPRSADAAQAFTETLKNSQLFSRVQGKITTSPTDSWQQFYQNQRYQLLSSESRRRLQSDDPSLVKESLGRLYSPLASVVGAQLIEDPLQLFFQWRLAVTPRLPFALEDGWLTRSEAAQHYRLISAELSENPYDIAYQQQVMATLLEAQTALPPESQLLSSGLILHAAHGAKQAIGEISTIGLGSALGILLLLFICFQRVRTVALAFVPLVIGCLIALTLSLVLFDRVHLITLAFGAGLVGVAIDYVLHFLCAHNHENTDSKGLCRPVLPIILPSLTMGLVSSVLAYTAQGMAPFPGLRQMAVFSVIGLIGAWLTVLCWLPLLQGQKPISFNPVLINQLRQWQSRWPKVDSVWVKIVLIILSIGLIAVVANIKTNDDIRLLQTSPPKLLEEDIAVQTLLQAASPAQYLVLKADSEEALLQLEESYSEKLSQAIDTGLITGFMATSQYLPSQQRQLDNRALLEDKVYAPEGQLHRLVNSANFPTLESQARQSYQDVPLTLLQLKDWQNSDICELAAHLWIGELKGNYYSIVTLFGIRDTSAIEKLALMANTLDGVEFVDRVSDISNLLSNYREQLLRWLLLAYGLVLVLATLRYGRDAWRVLAAPALASLLVMSLLQITGSTITIFHSLALLLVLGIGLDASIFLQDDSRAGNSSPYTWLAVTLSSLTTLLAFGLLALSSTPVLHYFGVTVLLGIICVWLLAPCFIKAHDQQNQGRTEDSKPA